jgi:hypothetical protein
MRPWFRVPSFLPLLEPGEAAAWIFLLGSWHNGHNPGINETRRKTGWGAGRTTAFMKTVAEWAESNGADVAEVRRKNLGNTCGTGAERERNGSGTPGASENADNRQAPEQQRNGSGTGAERERNDSRARDLLSERETEKETEKREEKGERARATPPLIEPSPLMSLLMGAGMAGGYASAAARALADAGVTDPAGAADLDEFDLGRIVGPARKALVIKAFRGAGWVPPKERRAVPAMPRPVVITEDGARVDPAGPVRPLSKSEAMIEALQQLKREGGRDGQRIRNN